MDAKKADIAIKAHNGKLWSPRQMMQHGISEIESGERECTKALVITLDDSNGRYRTGFLQSGMSASEVVALVDIFKARLMNDEGMV